MPSNAELIQHLLDNASRNRQPTYDEWVAQLAQAKSPDFVTLVLGYGLTNDCCEWRAKAVDFLLDLMNHSATDGRLINPKVRRDRLRDKPVSEWRTAAADAIVFNYLKDDPESIRGDDCRWLWDFLKSPDLYVKTLRTLRLHSNDPYMSQDSRPESVIKRFLKRCTTAAQWDEGKKFVEIRDQHLTDLFRTLLEYRMPDLIYRTDDLALESLKVIVFGPRDPDRIYGKPEPPKNMHEALVGNRRPAAERLVMLTARREAEDKEIEKKRVADEIEKLKRQQTALERT